MINSAQAADIRARVERNNAWSEQFRKPNGWTVITEEEQKTCPEDAQVTNEERGLLEQFQVLACAPQKLFAYVSFHEREIASQYSDEKRQTKDIREGDQARVHVWTGHALGNGRCNKVYRSNFGDRRASIGVVIGGATYSGTAYLDAGDYCRLRMVKG